VRVFNGHAGSVKTACLSANNRWVLSGSFDCTSRLWEVATDRWVRAFGGLQTHVVSSVMLSADGRWALSGSYGTTLRLWDVATGQCVRAFDGHAGSISKVVLSSDGRWALSGSSDHTIRLWEIATGKCVRIFEGYVDISSVALTTDSRWVLSGDYDHTIRLWEVATGQCVRSLEGHAGCITSVGLSADGRWVLSGSSDKTVRLWELDWDFEVREAIDWDETARPHLANFLTLHTPYAAVLPTDCKPSEEEITMALTRKGIPKWSEEDFKQLLHTLVCAGFGWIRPEGVRRELEKMVGSWSK
jgi:WD40 repeat protein